MISKLKFKYFLMTLLGLFFIFGVGFFYNNAQALESCQNTYTKDLRINTTSLDVKELQKYLNKNGFLLAVEGPGSPGHETNYFGNLTKIALIKFQENNNISTNNGVFDLITRNYLGCLNLDTHFEFTRNLFPGINDSDVKELQKYLNKNGFLLAVEGPGSPGHETNYFGNLTKIALIKFQENSIDILGNKSLNSENGYVSFNTRDFLNKEIIKKNNLDATKIEVPVVPKIRHSSRRVSIHSIEYISGSNGSITGILTQSVSNGENGTTVTAVPDLGYHFVDWSDSSTQNPRTDTSVTGGISVTANFNIDSSIFSHTLTYTAGSNGSIMGTLTQSVSNGENGTTVTAVPDLGYHFVDWSDSSTQNPRTDTSVTGGISVTANFAVNTYTINASSGVNGSISPSGITTKNYDSTQIYTITPAPNYHIAGVLVDGVSVGLVDAYSFLNISTSHTISATFEINSFILSLNNIGNGTGLTTGAGTYNYGTDITLTNTPNLSSNFISWGGDADCADGLVTINTDKTCTATFTLKTFILTYGFNPNGTISGTTSQNVNYNTSGTAVTAVPDSGYHFVDWSDSSTQNPRTDTSVTSDKSVMANFAFDVPVYSDWRWQPLSSSGNTVFTSALSSKTDSLSVDLTVGQTEEIILELDNTDNGGIFTYQLEGDLTTVWEVNSSQSLDSTNGIDGNWTILDTNLPGDDVGPSYELRDVNIANGPHRWFKFSVKNLGSATQTVSNFGLRKFSATDNDYWIFAGASIEAMSIDYKIMNERAKADYGYDPLIFNRGASAKTVQWLDDNINSILSAHPKAKFVTIHIGGNNVSNIRPYSTVSQSVIDDFSDSYRSVINKIKAAGKVPVPARISFRAYPNDPLGKPGTYAGGMPQNGSLPFNTEIVDPLIAELTPDFYDTRTGAGVVDLYTAILNDQSALGLDGVHPTTEGRQIYRDVWNDTAFKIIYSGLVPDYIVPMTFNNPAEDAEELIVIAETSREPVDINTAQDGIDVLTDWPTFSAEQAILQARLNQITPITSLRYWIDFGSSSYQASPNWNNLTAITSGSSVSNLVSDGGITGSIGLNVSYEFPAINSSGGLDFTGLPTYAMRDSFYLRGYVVVDSELTLSGLNLSKNYNLSFYSSANNALSYVTDFTINGTKKSVTSSGNSTGIITFNGLIPNAEGKIIITVGTDTNYGYLNAMSIREIDNLPNCSDGIQNQDETGIDTGGVCGVPHTLTYTAGSNGSITGTSPQIVNNNTSGTAVTAVPDSGYHFVDWSDSSTQNPRTDTSVTSDKSVMANFAVTLGTCSDGIQNQNETGVDTGGVCAAITYLIDFGITLQTTGNWNNMTAYQLGSVLTDIIDNTGTSSNVDVTITSKFTSSTTSGSTTAGIYPPNVIIDSFYVSTASSPAIIKFSGLNTSDNYTFKLFASRTGTELLTDYVINGTTVTLDCTNNFNRQAIISNVTPNGSGEIFLNVYVPAGKTYGYLGAVELIKN